MSGSQSEIDWGDILSCFEELGLTPNALDLARISINWIVPAQEECGLDPYLIEFIDEEICDFGVADTTISGKIPKSIVDQLRGRTLGDEPLLIEFGQERTWIKNPSYNEKSKSMGVPEEIAIKAVPYGSYYLVYCDYNIPLKKPPYKIPKNFTPGRVVLVPSGKIDLGSVC